MNDPKKMQLREKVDAELARQEAREQGRLVATAQMAKDKMTTVAREHPVALIFGGLAVGFAVSTLIPRSPTRKLSKSSLAFVVSMAEIGLAYSKQAMDSMGEAVEEAAEAAGEARKTGRKKIGKVSGRLQRRANKLGKKVAAATGY